MFFEMLSTFVQSVGALQAGSAASKAAAYNKQIDNYNSAVTLQAGQIAEDQLRRQATQSQGMNRANIGASGFSSEGSPMDVLQQGAYNAEMDALTTRYNYKTKATGYQMAGELEGQRGRSAATGSYLAASGTLLAGSGKAYAQNASDNSAGTAPFRLGSY